MKRATLYSRSPRTLVRRVAPDAAPAVADAPPPSADAPALPESTGSRAGSASPRRARWQRLGPQLGWFVAGLAIAALFALWLGPLQAVRAPLTQEDIDAAVLHTMETKNMPSRAARAAAAVMPAIVRVRTTMPDDRRNTDFHQGRAMGTGVLVSEDGTILTSLHVVSGATSITLTYHDRSESEAILVLARPDKDLAVLKARRVPDEIQPATLRSTAGVVPGDEVVAIGFPFGIGPSVSSGVVSGLGREHRARQSGSKEGDGDGSVVLTNLIQFDAAANPGNSGGPLITMDGQVVGIVCSILNPTDQAVFIGIGLAVPIEDAAAAAGMPPA